MKTKTNPWSSKNFLLADAAAILAAAFLLSTGSAQAAPKKSPAPLAKASEKATAVADKSSPQPELTFENAAIGLAEAQSQALKKQGSTLKKEEPAAHPETNPPSPDLVTATTYAFTSSTGATLEDMSSGTTLLLAADFDDAASAIAPIGFDFWYDGVRQNLFSVNANGLMRLGVTVIDTAFSNSLATTTDAPKIAPYWDDLWVGATTGKIHYKVVGSAPTRKLVVEWTGEQIPRVAAATVGAGTFQAWLYESTGKIEFVYGSGIAANSGNYSVGLQSGAATNFASVTTAAATVSYATANNSNTAAITAGTKYTFTPNIPADPGALSFTAVGLNAMTLNWADNATNEVGYAIYRSLDGTNYEFVAQTAANAITSIQTGLASNTTYFWRVFAVTEGGTSNASSGSQATTTGTISGVKKIGPTAGFDYTTIAAAVTDINTNGLAGNVILELQAAYVSTVETFPLVINTLGSPSNTITIRPETGATGLSITSANATATLDLNGATTPFGPTNVIIDGRAGGAGPSQLTIANTVTTGVAARLINGACRNTIQFCTIQGVNTSTTGGVVLFSTSTAGTGNNNNTIDSCDIKDGATTPANGITSIGTSAAALVNTGNTISNCNISNFFSATTATNGILIGPIAAGSWSNTRWTVSNNRIFQTAARAYTTAATHSGIQIVGGHDYIVTGNVVGFANSAGTGTYTMTGAVANVFQGIVLTPGTSSTSSIQNNTVAGISMTTTTGGLSGIALLSGSGNIGNVTGNTVGSGTGTGSITVTTTVAGAGGNILGINVVGSATGTVVISNNTVGSLTATGSATGNIGIIAMQVAAGAPTVTNNLIGSASTANSINVTSTGVTGTAQNVLGMNVFSTMPTTISGNTIANLTNAGTGTAHLIRGLGYNSSAFTTGGSAGLGTISLNSVHDITGANANTTVAGGATGVQGILYTGLSLTGGSVDQNTVKTISCTNTGAVSSVASGIGYSNPTNGSVTRNTIYDIRNASTGTTVTAPPMGIGILIRAALGAGGTFSNNMISLGASQTTNTQFVGLMNSFTNGGTNSFYNSVNITGTAAAGALPTYAFLRGDNTATSAITSVVNVKNNILNNTRTGGTGKHYAIGNVNTTPATGWSGTASNNNVLNSASAATVGIWGLATDETFSNWKIASGGDASSLSGVSVVFVDAPNGDLHVNFGVTPTALESGGITIGGLTTDFDNQTRPGPAGSVNGGATAPDIGADEFDGVPLDILAPAISYTPFANTISTSNRTLTTTITDATAVAVGANLPRIYFKKSTDASYVSTQCSMTGGTAQNGTYDCTTDYSLVGGGSVTGNDVIQYFVAAQDTLGNLGSNPPGATGASVNTVTFSGTPNSYTILPTISGVKSVGAGGDFTTLTAAAAALNAAVMTGPVTFNLTDASYTTPAETFPITITANSGASATNTLTIKPTGTTTITGSSATTIFDLSGCKFVTIDGSNSGGLRPAGPSSPDSTSGDLTIRNTGTGATIRFIADASNDTVKRATIEGQNTSTTGGVVFFSTGTTTGNQNNTIDTNTIRDRSDAAGVPVNLIYSAGTSAAIPNKTNTISNNQLNNFTTSGMTSTSTGNDSWTITGNTIFESAARTTALTGIAFNAAGTNTITLNTVRDLNTSLAATGMQFGNAFGTTVSQNRIFSIPSTSGSTGALNGMRYNGGSGLLTSLTLVNNQISIVPSFTNSQTITGIEDDGFSGNVINAYYNSVLVSGTASGSATWAYQRKGATPTSTTLTDNIFFNNRTGGSVNHFAAGDDSANTGTWSSNNNVFVGTGTTAANFMDYGTTSSGTPVSSAAWQTGPPARDASSQFSNPTGAYTVAGLFASTSDLHIRRTTPATLAPVENAGVPVGGVTNDFDNDTRANPPDIGADEVMTVNFSAAAYRPSISGSSEGTTATITVNRTSGAGAAATVNFSVSNGTATGGASCGAGVDYVPPVSTVLNFAAGDTSKTFDIALCADGVYEGPETVLLALTTVTGDAIKGTPDTATLTIVDGDAQPTATIGNVSQAELNSGTSTFSFPVTLSGPSATSTTINYLTGNGSASAGSDYVGVGSGSIVIPALSTTGSIDITVNGDTAYENNETFTVTISSPDVLISGTGVGTGTITNDDAQPTISINNVTVSEGGGTADFVVTQSAISGLNTTFQYTTADVTATAGSDYTGATNAPGGITAGTTTTTISIPILKDGTFENDETFTVTLNTPTNATIATGTGTGTITDNDCLTPPSTVYVDDNWAGTPLGNDPDGPGPATSFGCDSFATVQGGVNGVAIGGTVHVAPGTYTENVTINKALTLIGAGKGADDTTNTVLTNSGGVGIMVTHSDVTVSYLRVRDYTAGGHSDHGIELTGGALNNVLIDHCAATNTSTGVALQETNNVMTNITVQYCDLLGNRDSGLYVYFPTYVNGLTIDNCNIQNNAAEGIELYQEDVSSGLPLAAATSTNVHITNSTVSHNAVGQPGDSGFGNITVYGFNGDIEITNVTIDATDADYGIYLRGHLDANDDPTVGGTMTLTNVSITGAPLDWGIHVAWYTGVNLPFDDVTSNVNLASGASPDDHPRAALFMRHLTNASAIDLGNTILGGTRGTGVGHPYDLVASHANINATGVTFTQTAPFAIEDVVLHRLDISPFTGSDPTGLVTWVANNIYVTQDSGSIQRGIDAASSGNIVNVQTGSYAENVSTAGKAVTLAAGASPGQVTINGDLTLDGDDTLPIEINGTNPATQYDNFIINGAVTLGGANLVLSGTHNPQPGQTFTIVSNDASDPVSGTFAGLPEGAVISNFLGSNFDAKITYAGGSNSNDVVLTVLAADVSVAVSPASVAEDGGTNLDYTFTRSGNTTGTLTVNFSVGGTAGFGSDYAQSGADTFSTTSGTVTFAATSATAVVTIDPTTDAVFEANETVVLTVTSGTNYNPAAPISASGTITNDDTQPTISINNVTVSENGGNAIFTVTQSAISGVTTTFQYSTADNTAVAPGDYTAATNLPGQITAGNTTTTISIPITDDGTFEPTETFTVTLNTPTNATIATGTGTGTITDDDPRPLPPITYVDDNWISVPNGQDPDGAGPATEMGYDAFATIQGGVNGVAASRPAGVGKNRPATIGTVIVYAGTYAETVNVNKSVLLLGAQAGVNPNDVSWNDVRTNLANEAVIEGPVNLSLQNTITVDGFTIVRSATNEGHILIGGGLPSGSGSTSQFTIQNNRITGTRDTGTTWAGIHTNFLDNFPGPSFIYPGANATITHNRIVIAGDASGDGILINRLVPGTDTNSSLSITGNYLASDPFFGSAVAITQTQTSVGVAQITGNYLPGGEVACFRTLGANIAGNQMITPAFDGVWLNGGDDNITVTGNTITNPQLEAIVIGDFAFSTPTPRPNSNLTVSNNIVTVNAALLDPSSGPTYSFFKIGGGLTGTNNINGNSLTITGALPGGITEVYGMRVHNRNIGAGSDPQTVGSVSMANNTISGGGLLTGDSAGLKLDSNLTSSTQVTFGTGNSITGFPFGVDVKRGSATISGSTISETGTAVRVDATSSGADPVTVAITNSTLSGSTAASGGALYSVGTGGIARATITNSTLSENSPTGTSIFLQDASLTVGNSIFHAGDSGTNISANGTSTVASLGYNLSSDNFSNLNLGGSFLTNTGDQINTDPMLGPLKNNGGPTLTHAPLNGSPAIDKGKDIGPIGPAYSATGVDQRNGSRPITYDASIVPPSGGDRSDIGSVELALGVKPDTAASWLMHGPAGFFPIDLPLTGPVGVECRSGGVNGDYEIIVTFAQPITFSSADVTSGTGTVSGTSVSRPSSPLTVGTQVTIDLTGVTNAQTIVVALFDVNDTVNSGDVGIRMGVLLGDTTGNGVVDSADITQVRRQSGLEAHPTNFREDLTVDGVINSGDITVVRRQTGTALP